MEVIAVPLLLVFCLLLLGLFLVPLAIPFLFWARTLPPKPDTNKAKIAYAGRFALWVLFPSLLTVLGISELLDLANGRP